MNIFAKTLATEIKILCRYKNSIFIGIVMQIFWGWLNIMIFSKFILQSTQSHFSLRYLCSYVWLMQSFIGITALWIKEVLSEIPDVNCFESAGQYAAFVDVTPSHFQSGTSVNGRSHISRIGSRSVRKTLYMSALVVKNNRHG